MPIDDSTEADPSAPTGGAIINAGAVIAALLGVPCFFIILYGVAGVVTGAKLVGGFLGAVWGYLVVVGTYELNRRKFDWERGRKHSDQHLMAGTIAVSTGLMMSGVMHESMPALAIIPALSAIKQANDGREGKILAWIHAAILSVGIAVGIWFFNHKATGLVLLERAAEWP